MYPNLLVFASGSATGGGSGFQKLVEATKSDVLGAHIVGVVSNHPNGGVRKLARKLGIPFTYFPGPYTADEYQAIYRETSADFVSLSGWLKMVRGLPPDKTINIHPGPLPEFGGKGMYGHHVHEAVMRAYRKGKVTHSAVCMHFVTEEYDEGPLFLRHQVEIILGDTADTLGARVNAAEHEYQAVLTNLVVTGRISWDGKNPETLQGAEEWMEK